MNDAPHASGPGPLGLALFLAAAVILFVAILAGYAVMRVSDPGAFSWAPTLLNRRLGMITAATLIITCIASAAALRFALAAKVGRARGLLGVALVAGAAALVVRAIELPSTSRIAGIPPRRAEVASTASHGAPAATATHIGDAVKGKRIFLGTCAACHAPDGSGVKGQGQNLRDSTFLKDMTAEKALAFVKAGRQPFDPESKLHLSMPARGGNPSLDDASLLDAIAYVRELERQAAVAVTAATSAPASPAARTASGDQPQVIDGELWLPHSILPSAASGPSGSAPSTVALQKPGAEGRAASNVRRFFVVVLFVNGLHAFYLIFGQVLGLWLLASTAREGVPKLTLAMAAVYWIVMGAIGLVLLPAFYF